MKLTPGLLGGPRRRGRWVREQRLPVRLKPEIQPQVCAQTLSEWFLFQRR